MVTTRYTPKGYQKPYDVSTTMRPNTKLRSLLVHPKDRRRVEACTVVVYSCSDCKKSYIGETGRKFGIRKLEYQHEAELVGSALFTRDKEKEVSPQ